MVSPIRASLLFQPITIGKATVKNRLVLTAHEPRLPQARYVRYIEERARGGVGLIIFCGTFASQISSYSAGPPARFVPGYARDPDVVKPNPATPEGRKFYDDTLTPTLRELGQVVHRHGAACFGQLGRTGAYAIGGNWQPGVSASPVPDPFRCEVPHELETEEIRELVGVFAQSARRIKEAGLDGIEINAVHGLLHNEFLSPHSNHRTDVYGGSLDNRLRFLFEIIEEIREQVGKDFPLGVRLFGDEFVEDGLGITDMQEIAQRLAERVDFIGVSTASESGLKGGVTLMNVAPWYVAPGPLVPLASALRQCVDIPIIVSCRINDPLQAEKILAEGHADLIGMVRAHIADPEFANKARAGQLDDIRKCLGCNEGCRHRTLRRWATGLPIGCTGNAAAGREEEMELIPASVRKRVLVAGGGPAGLEAARVAALRGHRVTLCEREGELGGQVSIFTRDSRRQDFGEIIRFLSRQVEKLGVEIRLNTEVTPELVKQMAPDAVVTATGSTPFIPPIPGIDRPNVVNSWQVLKGEAKVGNRVVVIGGIEEHQAPPSLAEFLADQGKEVEVLSELMQVGQGIEPGTLHLLMKRLLEKKITLSPLTAVKAIEDGRVIAFNVFTKTPRIIQPVDTVVLAMGNRADNRLYLSLKGRVKELYAIGDCLAPRRVLHGVLEGARAGRHI